MGVAYIAGVPEQTLTRSPKWEWQKLPVSGKRKEAERVGEGEETSQSKTKTEGDHMHAQAREHLGENTEEQQCIKTLQPARSFPGGSQNPRDGLRMMVIAKGKRVGG